MGRGYGPTRLVGARLDRDVFSFAVLVSFPTSFFSLQLSWAADGDTFASNPAVWYLLTDFSSTFFFPLGADAGERPCRR